MKKIIIVTGLAGAGKSITLNVLEDLGYYCVDNLPTVMLKTFVADFARNHHQDVAIGIDSRDPNGIARLPELICQLREDYALQVIFLTANDRVLTQRFNETRRPHPLSLNSKQSVASAIQNEMQLLSDVLDGADWIIDTSTYSATDLRQKLSQMLTCGSRSPMLSLQSFGFKHGIPANADFVFDVRFLPNPHWVDELRPYNGTQQPIIEYLTQFSEVKDFCQETAQFLKKWLAQFDSMGNRAYISVCFGCTGGQHRSVYVAEQIAKQLKPLFPHLEIEHRDMQSASFSY